MKPSREVNIAFLSLSFLFFIFYFTLMKKAKQQ